MGEEYKTFKSGDVVQLKSGGLPMTISFVRDHINVDCCWMNKAGEMQLATVKVVAIEHKREAVPIVSQPTDDCSSQILKPIDDKHIKRRRPAPWRGLDS